MFRSFIELFSGSLVGKLTGVLREVLLAGMFGTSGTVAALRAAQSATLVPVNFFTADSLSAGFLPLYARYRDSDSHRAATLFWWTASLLMIASAAVVILLIFGAPYWVGVLVPGFGDRARDLTIEFVRIMGVGVPFYIASGLFSYVEMGHGSYLLASARATLQSAGLIAGTVAAFVLHAPALLAWGFTIAYVIYAAWGLFRVTSRGWIPNPSRLRRADLHGVGAEFWRIVKPLALLPVLLQGNIVAERAVASLLGVGTSAALDYAKFISDTGILLFAVPLGLAGLSSLSKMSDEQAKATLRRLIPPLLLTTVPVSMALAVNSQWIIALVYQRGHFDAASTHLTQLILWGYGAGFWAQVCSYVLMKALSAKLRNGAVFRFMALALIANMLINFSLYRVLGPAVLGIGGCVYGVILLALSARSLDVGRVVADRIGWLALGSLGYVLPALAFGFDGWFGIAVAGVWFAAWWSMFITVVPALRSDVKLIYAKWRMER